MRSSTYPSGFLLRRTMSCLYYAPRYFMFVVNVNYVCCNRFKTLHERTFYTTKLCCFALLPTLIKRTTTCTFCKKKFFPLIGFVYMWDVTWFQKWYGTSTWGKHFKNWNVMCNHTSHFLAHLILYLYV